LRHQGKLNQVLELCEQQWQFVTDAGISQTVAAGWLLALWGDVLAEKNELEEALQKAQKGVELAGHGSRDVSFFGWTNLYCLRVLYSSGDVIGAEKILQKMQNIAKERNFPRLVPIQINAWQARMWISQNNLDAANQWIAARELSVEGEISFQNEIEHLVLARVLIAQEKLDEATRILNRLLEYAEAGGRVIRVIEILILQALAFQSKGDFDQALDKLEQTLILAEPEKFIRTFVDEGSPMARLLYEALSREIAPNYVRQLLAAFPDVEAEQTDTTENQSSDDEWIEPLSERELEVLQLIAEGLTNREVGERLYLTQNTVKAHARTIYSKLGVNNRTQAMNRARALGII